jgi:hypothetical protein
MMNEPRCGPAAAAARWQPARGPVPRRRRFHTGTILRRGLARPGPVGGLRARLAHRYLRLIVSLRAHTKATTSQSLYNNPKCHRDRGRDPEIESDRLGDKIAQTARLLNKIAIMFGSSLKQDERARALAWPLLVLQAPHGCSFAGEAPLAQQHPAMYMYTCKRHHQQHTCTQMARTSMAKTRPNVVIDRVRRPG